MRGGNSEARMRPRSRSAYAVTLVLVFTGWPGLADDKGLAFSARSAEAAHAAECVCRAQGRTFAVGESACLRTAAGARVAECGMVLNNTSWQFTARPCPES